MRRTGADGRSNMQQRIGTSPPVRHEVSATSAYACMLVAMLWAAVSFCNYADRSVLSAVMPDVRTEFDLSLPQLGLLCFAFLWAYALSILSTGEIVTLRHA
jgi:sugar phosphate permease